MSRIRSQNTTPELLVRRFLHGNGLRYRLKSKLPGKPDIAFTKKKIAVFVHGCFWHVHNCKRAVMPKTNVGYWAQKLDRNKERDKAVQEKLKKTGWKIYVIWECQLKKEADIYLKKLLKYIKSN